MSGGVDSSAAALLLQKQGYECAGATLSLCGNETDGAKRIADGLGMPFYIFDEHELFAREVMITSSASTARAARRIRASTATAASNSAHFWTARWRWALTTSRRGTMPASAMTKRADVTGCCAARAARRTRATCSISSRRSSSHLLLPVGSFEKPEIREQAEEAGLANAHQADSQDICFIPDGDYVRFLRDYGGVTPQPGDFVDETGRVLGRHRGLECYTAGQRKGLGVSADRPLYVISKMPKIIPCCSATTRNCFPRRCSPRV